MQNLWVELTVCVKGHIIMATSCFPGHWLNWHLMAAGHWPWCRKRSVQLQQSSEGEWGKAQLAGKQRQEWGTGELEKWHKPTGHSACGRRDGREHSRAGLFQTFPFLWPLFCLEEKLFYIIQKKKQIPRSCTFEMRGVYYSQLAWNLGIYSCIYQ